MSVKPGLSGLVDNLEKQNPGNSVVEIEIAKMREILSRPEPKNEEERKQRMAIAIADHKRVMTDFFLKNKKEGDVF